jgi:hypothetical protein
MVKGHTDARRRRRSFKFGRVRVLREEATEGRRRRRRRRRRRFNVGRVPVLNTPLSGSTGTRK